MKTQDISESAKEITLASWRTTTKNRHKTIYRKWQEFCGERNINNIQPTVNVIFFHCYTIRAKIIGPSVMPEVL